jgi:hypothetical protein
MFPFADWSNDRRRQVASHPSIPTVTVTASAFPFERTAKPHRPPQSKL